MKGHWVAVGYKCVSGRAVSSGRRAYTHFVSIIYDFGRQRESREQDIETVRAQFSIGNDDDSGSLTDFILFRVPLLCLPHLSSVAI